MKIIERLKKGLIGIGAFLLTIPTKVFALQDSKIVSVALYGIQKPDFSICQAEYGVPRTRPILTIWRVARTFIIPIALLIGLIVYFKKSKSSIKKKILVTIVSVAITVILYFVVNKIIYG